MKTIETANRPIDTLTLAWGQRFGEVPPVEKRIGWLSEVIVEIKNQLLDLGERAYEALPTENKSIDLVKFEEALICYEWMEQAKLFLLLMRDTLFEQQKSALLLLDDMYSGEDVEQFWLQSFDGLNRALVEFNKRSVVNINVKEVQTKLKEWKHQENPWPLYKKQLQLIEEQAQKLLSDFETLHQLQLMMQEIVKEVGQVLKLNWEHLNNNKSYLNQILDLLSLPVIEKTEKPKQILNDLHHIFDKLNTIDSIDDFKTRLENLLATKNEKINPVVHIHNGFLERRTFQPKDEILLWFNAAIYPLLFEVVEIAERGTSGLKMVLVNLTNRMDILFKDNPTMEALKKENVRLQKPLINYNKDLETIHENVTKIITLVNDRMERFFKLSCLFDTQRHFLPVSLQSTINRKFWGAENSWWAQIVAEFNNYKKKWNNYRNKLAHDHALSVSERLALCLQSRKVDPANSHYASIFLTKGYVGESFVVGRQQELGRFEQIVLNWKEGFRGAVLLHGNRFSGKTIFGEITARKFFPNNFYRLEPNASINVQGRKLQTTVDLKEALDFILKHQNDERPLIFIDDLELWWSDKIPFFQNIHELSECIDHYSNRIFFLVGMNSKINAQLFSFCQLDRIFQAEVDFNHLSKEAFQEAISIRHGATHKKLVNSNGEEITAPEFSKLVTKLYKLVHGNIGEGLNRWVNSMQYIDENTVECSLDTYRSLPVFLQEDSALLIEILLKYKRSNEYQLRQLLGEAFGTRYSALILRLMNTHVLKRQLDGFIEIEPSIVNDLQQMMD